MARRGFLGRIADSLRGIGRTLTGAPRRAEPSVPPRQPPEPPRRRRREEPSRDPFRATWDANAGRRTPRYGYHRDVLERSIPYWDDMDPDEQLAFWDAYTRYMVNTRGRPYKINTLANPFWSEVNMHPDDFDWQAWREATDSPRAA